ncbi:MAG: alpha/beta fold hydrolase [SAR202 cluster bacterium]|nr:alpha/beta fold hydrolase [SAR202 cluster bacterium]
MPDNKPLEGRFELGNLELQSGKVLLDAHLGYAAYGELNEARDNVIVYPTWYTGLHRNNDAFIGNGKALDPAKYFIVVPDMFTNGLSTSPSNCLPPFDGMNFPLVTPYDNVIAQYRLLTEHFAVTSLALAIGYSMSGQQAYHWGALYPNFVDRICAICGSAKTSAHNWVYLNGYKTIMEAGDGWNEGKCAEWPPKLLTAVAGLAATMGLSQDWYRESGFELMGASNIEEFLTTLNGFFASWVPGNLYHQTLTWMAADVSAHPKFDGDLGKALASIACPALIMPCDTDMYFRVADNEIEVAQMPNAELKVIHSLWGHLAGMPGVSAADDAFVDDAVRELLAR